MTMTNPYRNGIMQIFDTLSNSLCWHGFMHEIARSTLRNTLQNNATEKDALEYIVRMNKLTGELLSHNKKLEKL